MKYREIKLSDINKLIPISYVGEDCVINGLNLCNRQTIYQSILGYTTSELFFDAILDNCSIKAIVVSKEVYEKLNVFEGMQGRAMTYIISETPEILFYEIQNALCKSSVFYKPQSTGSIGKNCSIHPSAIVEDGALIGDNVVIGANSVVRDCVEIGDGTFIGSCTVIGDDGFQAIHGMKEHIHHSGGVKIGKGVTIGNNTCVCRSLFEGATIVGDYCKIDNLVQISHNCIIGNDCILCAGVKLLGSSYMEDDAYMAPGSILLNQKTVGKGAFVGSMSYVNKSVKPNTEVFGIPAKKLPQL